MRTKKNKKNGKPSLRVLCKRKLAERVLSQYDKPVTIEFVEAEKCNWSKRFHISKMIFERGNLSHRSLILYIVFCSRSDFRDNRWFHISYYNLGRLSGLSEPTVVAAVKELCECGLLSKSKESCERRYYNLYKVDFVRERDLKAEPNFSIYSGIIESGLWARLSRKAKLFYLSLKGNSMFKKEIYFDIEGWEDKQYFTYSERKWEICSYSQNRICEIVGINSSDAYKQVQELKNAKLIDKIGKHFLVYQKPFSLI